MKLLTAILQLMAATPAAATETVGCYKNAPFDQDDWMYCQAINDSLYMYYTPTEDTIMPGLHATKNAPGWTALAFGGNGGMKGASQIVVRRDDTTDEWKAEDRHSMDYTMPTLDAQQDVRLLFALQDEQDGQTAWGVMIPKNSCDPDDYDIQDKRMYMHWALGSDHTFGYHTARGQFHASMWQAPKVFPSTE